MPILHPALPFAPWVQPSGRRLPGVMPLARTDWLMVDTVYRPQMAERRRLLAEHSDTVLGFLPEAQEAAGELLDEVLHDLPQHGFTFDGESAICPDGYTMMLDRSRPLWTLGHLLQADFCLLQKQGGEHVLTGAVLCFPASWTLAEKLGKPLMRIHRPVESYDAELSTRVQRMFDLMRPEQPLWRANLLDYAEPSLFQPRPENAPRQQSGDAPYLRSERQCLLKLPRSGAVVFSIHTAVILRDRLTEEQQLALHEIETGSAQAGA